MSHEDNAETPDRARFRLPEVLVLIVIGIILVGLFIPSVQKARGPSYRTKCQNNLKQIGLATIQMSEIQKKLPPFFGHYGDKPVFKGKQYPASMWYQMLPYLEEAGIFDRLPPIFDVEKNTITVFATGANEAQRLPDPNENAGFLRVPVFSCPSDKSAPFDRDAFSIGLSSRILVQGLADGEARETTQPQPWAVNSCAANYLVFGTIPNARLPESFPDGTSKTILFTEKCALCDDQSTGRRGGNLWAFPPFFPPDANLNINYAGAVGYLPSSANPTSPYLMDKFQDQPAAGACDPALAQTAHGGGINVCMADGSVRLVSTGISPATWSAALTPGPIEGISYPVNGLPRADKLGSDWND
jgi:prepilin-type processing-associated H-X9-DG protein